MEIVWKPTQDQIQKSRLYRFMRQHGFSDYPSMHQKSIEDVRWFWDAFCRDMNLVWDKPYRQVLDVSQGWKWARWFPDGKINWVRNAVERHALGENLRHPAIIWEGEEGKSRSLTYRELHEEVNRLANGLRSLGIKKGDRAGIFMPMTPECVIAMLAVAKIGAISAPVFSGYGAEAVAARLRDCEAKLLFISDAFFRRGNLIPMKQTADEAMALSKTVSHCIVHSRAGNSASRNPRQDIDWDELVQSQSSECSAEATEADDPYLLIYTSGTTGKPKGTVHAHAGFPLKAAMDLAYHFDLQSSDVLFWFTDMGWMMGPWEVAGGLILGSTVFLFDGVPDFPEPDRLWALVEKYKITALGISPTLIRALMRHPVSWVRKHDLSSLRILGSTGEPWNPAPWWWYFENIGGKHCPVLNYSGGTEISGGILACSFLQPLKPCAFTGPALGMDADVVDEEGKPVRGEEGELVIRKPWVGMTRGFWKDPERYEQTYWSRFPDTWVHGDRARIDSEGYWFLEGRSDDTLKVAGKRIGPAEIESALTSHSAVSEAAAVGIPDELKGEVIVCFVVVKPGTEPDEALRAELKRHGERVLGKAVAPEAIKFVREIPKTRNGKVMRRLIRAKYLGFSNLGDLSGLENPGSLEAIAQAL